jgi:hypothetical protein
MGVVVECFDSLDWLAGCLASVANQTKRAQAVVIAVEERHRAAAQSIAKPILPGCEWVAADRFEARTFALKHLFCSAPLLLGAVFLRESARLERNYLAAVEEVFGSHPGVGQLSSLIIDPDICIAIRAEALSAGNAWATVTYPEALASVCPQRAAAEGEKQRRYSAIALAQRGSAKIAWSWFLAAPLTEKARWLGKVLTQPRRAAQWITWQVRGAALKAR